MSMVKKIMIIEDHPIVRRGLIQLLNRQKQLEVCATADSSASALAELDTNQPDLVTLDISLKDSNGLELLKDINTRWPDLPVLVLSMHDEKYYAERALKAGARGYIMKQEVTKELLHAIFELLKGRVYVSREMSTKLVEQSVTGRQTGDPISNLSDRELEVLEHLGQGKTTREISEEMNLGIKTVETYRGKIKDKLQLDNATQLIKFAVEWYNMNR
jgi:DNA-binding NarL/FixJ family response regulator